MSKPMRASDGRGVNMPKLIGSTPCLDELKEMLSNYFYSEITLSEVKAREWQILNSKGRIKGCRIVLKGKRYRFEMLDEKAAS